MSFGCPLIFEHRRWLVATLATLGAIFNHGQASAFCPNFRTPQRIMVAWDVPFSASGIGMSSGNSRKAATDAQRRGVELRVAIRRSYKELAASGGLRGGLHGTDVTDTVLPCIPIGTPFDEAIAILKDAGFSIEPYPDLSAPPNPNRARDWYALLAKIDPYKWGPFSNVALYVSLLPPSLGAYTRVSGLSATFFRSSL